MINVIYGCSLFLFVLVPFSSYANKQSQKIDLKSPQAAVSTFLIQSKEPSPNFNKAGKVLYGVSGEEAKDKAQKLSKFLRAYGLKVDVSKVPSDPNYQDTISDFEIENRYLLFPNRMPQIFLEQNPKNKLWYFSNSTVASIDSLYVAAFPYGTEWIQSRIPKVGHYRIFKMEIWQIVGLTLILLISMLLIRLLTRVLIATLDFIIKKSLKFIKDSFELKVQSISKTISLIIVISLIQKFLPFLQLDINVSNFLFNGFDFAFILLGVSFWFGFVNSTLSIFQYLPSELNSKMQRQFIPIINNLLKGIIVIAGILRLLAILGVNPTSVLAGASIGGLALALSAQDTVKNLLGGVIIFIDQPFQIGDWIEAGEVIGEVEHVGFRATKIRAFDTSIFQIPNSQIAELVINNKQSRRFRRYHTSIGIRYDTPPKYMESFIDGIRNIIEKHPNAISQKHNVEFDGFGDFSLNILINVYFIDCDWATLQQNKHMLHISILTLANEMGVGFAFPSNTLMVEQFSKNLSEELSYSKNKMELEEALKRALATLGNK